MGGDPNASGPTGSGGAQTPVLPSGPSKSDDSAALFPESTFAKETGDNPFLGSKEGFLEGDANLFKADLEFKPAPPANPNGGGYGSGNATEGMDFSDSVIDGFTVSPESLKGVIMNEEQALACAVLLGIRIRH